MLSQRNPSTLGEWGSEAYRAIAKEAYWRLPYKWDRLAAAAGERRRVFALSLGDWLEVRYDLAEYRARMLKTIDDTPNLDWLLLTKRPANFVAGIGQAVAAAPWEYRPQLERMCGEWIGGKPPANVWVGVSIENQEWANKRVPLLSKIPAVVRFLSIEPMLGAVDLLRAAACGYYCDESVGHIHSLRFLSWVIVGGESGGRKSRFFEIDWARQVLAQCRAEGVAVFVKQLGSNPIEDENAANDRYAKGRRRVVMNRVIELSDAKGGDWDEWPADLKVREFPQPRSK